MSRIGKLPVEIPEGVTVTIDGRNINVTGPKGELNQKLMPGFELEQKENRLELSVTGDKNALGKYYGLMRTLLANMVIGVSEGFSKVLEVNGVGFRVSLQGQKLVLNLGFSHPIEYTAPDGIQLNVEQTTITVSGIDKQKVGEVAAEIRSYKKPEPYKGKGIKYQDEVIRRKAGKAAAKAGAGE
jgi:large subunit ribosomal protein L6